MKSTMASSGYHELQSRLYEDMPRFLSRQNIVIMICRDGRYRSVANAEMWSNTLTRYGPISTLRFPATPGRARLLAEYL